MAWTKADILNQALRHLGITEFIQNPDSITDTHANILRGFYDDQVRTHLEIHDWSFARTYYSLGVPTGEESPHAHMPYIYQRPPACMTFRSIYSEVKDVRIPWIVGLDPVSSQQRIYTTIPEAVGVYTLDVKELLSVWSYSFGGMIAAIMAYHYSGVRAPKKSKFIAQIYADARKNCFTHSAAEQGDMENLNDFHTSAYESVRG
jgi:hypothetical protein